MTIVAYNDYSLSLGGSIFRGVISPQNMYNHVQKRTENQNVPVPEMGRRKRWWAHTLWGKSDTLDLAF